MEEHEHSDEVTEDAEDAFVPARELPTDLPRSLDDRRTFTSYGEETEMYDAWQGLSLTGS